MFRLLCLSFIFVVFGAGHLAFSQVKPTESLPTIVSAPPFAISSEDEESGIHGVMKVAVEIDKGGNVTRASVYVGPSWPCSEDFDKRVNLMMRDAEKSVLGYKFSPAVKNGIPVESRIGLTIQVGKAAREKLPVNPPSNTNGAKDPNSINGGVLNGKAISLPRPAYPAQARAERASGAVSVQVLISEEGKILSAQAVDGSPLLQFAARASACGARFSPTLLEGKPVKVSGVIVYNFVP